MLNIRTAILTVLAVPAIGAVWQARTTAQENAGIITVFDHDKLNASFARAVSNGGSDLLWSHTSSKGTYSVDTHGREPMKGGCKPEGCSHKDFTAVVIVESGSATLVMGGTTKASGPDKFGGQPIQGGESHRITRGDVYIAPPDSPHWYKDIEPPFQYIEVPVP
jgi:mannose-6-phosphate isomerase-like protein (cupin superfamily)